MERAEQKEMEKEQQQEVVHGPQSLKYLLSSPLQKVSAGPACR